VYDLKIAFVVLSFFNNTNTNNNYKLQSIFIENNLSVTKIEQSYSFSSRD